MRRNILISALLVCPFLLHGQLKDCSPRPWMFTLEETGCLPGLNKGTIEERATEFIETADKAGGVYVLNTINKQTGHRVIEYWYPNEPMSIRGRKYKVDMRMSVSIQASNGAYKVTMERLEALGHRGRFAVFDDIIRSDDDSGPEGFARGKAKEDIPELCKTFAVEKFKTLLQQIRTAMEIPVVDVLMEEVK